MTAGAIASSPLIISHRCLGFGKPENSVAGMMAALRSSADAVEVDVRLTKDFKWVAIHNPFFHDEERSVKRVHEHTAAALRREVTRLDTMLALVATHPDKQVFVDVKDVGEEKQLARLIRLYGLAPRAIVISWEPEVLRRLHARDPDLRLGFSYVPLHHSLTYLCSSVPLPLSRHGVLLRFDASHSFDSKHVVGKTSHYMLSEIPQLPLHSIQVPSALCSAKLIRKAHARRLRVFPFGVHTRLGYALLRRRGIDGVMTDYPLLFVQRSTSSAARSG